jgi:hypothetical protein
VNVAGPISDPDSVDMRQPGIQAADRPRNRSGGRQVKAVAGSRRHPRGSPAAGRREMQAPVPVNAGGGFNAIRVMTAAVAWGMFLMVLLGLPGAAFSQAPAGISETLPELGGGLSPGVGLPVAKIQRVQGPALVFHAERSRASEAAAGLPLFPDDRIETLENARVVCRLDGGDLLVVAPTTELTFQPRGLGLDAGFGPARIYLKRGHLRLDGTRAAANAGPVTVLTDGAFIDARRSDTVIRTDGYLCQVISLEGSTVRAAGRLTPDASVGLTAGQAVAVVGGEIRSAPESLAPARLQFLRREFTTAPPSMPSRAELDARRPVQNAGGEDANEEDRKTYR